MLLPIYLIHWIIENGTYLTFPHLLGFLVPSTHEGGKETVHERDMPILPQLDVGAHGRVGFVRLR